MTGEIVLFERTSSRRADPRNIALVRAIDAVAPRALQSVAGNEADTARVKELLSGAKAEAMKGGRAGAINYLARMNTQVV